MFHQHNDEHLDQFFQRLNKPLKRMPQPARAELHAELRQHLAALVAAHEELGSTPEEALDLALRQFGDPAKIGHRLWWEWFLSSRRRPSEGFLAAGYALVLYALCDLLFALPPLLAPLGDRLVPSSCMAALRSGGDFLRYAQTLELLGLLTVLAMTLGVPALVGWLVGRKFPRHSLRAMFGVALAPTVWILPAIVLANLPPGQGFAGPLPAALACAAGVGGLGAVLGGARKGNKPRLSLAGFKRRRN